MPASENPRLKAEMDELKDRIDQLSQAEGAICPLCGQPLEPHDRLRLIDELNQQGKELGDRYRQNLALLKESDQTVRALDERIATLASVEANRLGQTEAYPPQCPVWRFSRLSRRNGIHQGAPRLAEVQAHLANEDFAPQAMAQPG